MRKRIAHDEHALRDSYDRGEWRPIKGLRRAAEGPGVIWTATHLSCGRCVGIPRAGMTDTVLYTRFALSRL